MTENKQAKIYEQIKKMVDNHDDGGCPYKAKATGVITSYFDLQRLGWEEGDIVYPSKSIKIWAGEQAGIMRVMCDAEDSHNKPGISAEERIENGEMIIVDAEPLRRERIGERELVTV